MTTATTNQMIARRTRKGYNAQESAEMIVDLIARHNGENLIHALTYNEFANEAQARKAIG